MKRTLSNCSLIKRQIKSGAGRPEQYHGINKCLGYAKSDNDDGPCEDCKKRKLYICFEE